jgi:hypothetical protein
MGPSCTPLAPDGWGTITRLTRAVPLLLGWKVIVYGGTGMGTHTLLRQCSDLGGPVLRSQSQHFGGLRGGPGLSGRVVLYRLGGSQNQPR